MELRIAALLPAAVAWCGVAISRAAVEYKVIEQM